MAHFVIASGNLLEAEVSALVNTVNTVGVMGKGIALQFKRAFPDNFKSYERACKSGQVVVGEVFVYDVGRLTSPRWIINFPTKRHWRAKSKLGDIDRCLDDLAATIDDLGITSIAMPPLGCGNGGLSWADVEPLIRRKLDGVEATVHLYPPHGAPPASEMLDARDRPDLTPGKAALVMILDRYSKLALGASVVEVQKLMYFLQEAGQDLRLRYEEGIYGPYADDLRRVLSRLEGHHLQGYGDGSKSVQNAEPILVLPGAADEAEHFLIELGDHHLMDRIERTLELTHGFESAYGLELLASVHWCATRRPNVTSADSAAACVRSWTSRKGRLFTDDHVAAAWDHLRHHGWLDDRALTSV